MTDERRPTDNELLALAADVRNAGELAARLNAGDQARVAAWLRTAHAEGLPDEELPAFRLGLYLAATLLLRP